MNTSHRIAIITLSELGAKLAQAIGTELGADVYILAKYCQNGIPFENLSEIVSTLFSTKKALIFVMAQGIAIRTIAPLLKSKYTDPAVVVCDDIARFVISTASGHEGGANGLAFIVASITGATPVITTATQANKLYIAGIGTRKGVSTSQVVSAVTQACKDIAIQPSDLRLIATAWLKKDETGLIEAANQLDTHIRFIPKFLFDIYADVTIPTAAANHFDIPAVAEPSAIIAAQHAKLVLPMQRYDGVTVAISQDTVGGVQ